MRCKGRGQPPISAASCAARFMWVDIPPATALCCSTATVMELSDVPLAALPGLDLARHIAGLFDDLVGLAIQPQDQVVGGLDPDIMPIHGPTPELPSLILTGGQRLPEVSVIGPFSLAVCDKDRMMLALDFFQPVAKGRRGGRVGPFR